MSLPNAAGNAGKQGGGGPILKEGGAYATFERIRGTPREATWSLGQLTEPKTREFTGFGRRPQSEPRRKKTQPGYQKSKMHWKGTKRATFFLQTARGGPEKEDGRQGGEASPTQGLNRRHWKTRKRTMLRRIKNRRGGVRREKTEGPRRRRGP